MSETNILSLSNPNVFKMFAGFQNNAKWDSAAYVQLRLKDDIYVTKISLLESYYYEINVGLLNQDQTIRSIYADSTQDLGVNTFLLHTPETLTSFFLSNSLDIPRTFKRIRSLMHPASTTILAKLSAILTKHGRKTYISQALTRSLIQLTYFNTFNKQYNSYELHWRVFYQMFTSLKFLTDFKNSYTFDYIRYMPYVEYNDLQEQGFSSITKQSSPTNIFSPTFVSLLQNYTPLFSFFIKKVSKLKWKHSRGKSGRYTITWKYIPIYKRLIVLLRWLSNDIQFQNYHNFVDRLHNSLKNLTFTPSLHLIAQFRQFVHKYVFQRCKNTLLLKLHMEV